VESMRWIAIYILPTNSALYKRVQVNRAWAWWCLLLCEFRWATAP
jgi:hypothetical protein